MSGACEKGSARRAAAASQPAVARGLASGLRHANRCHTLTGAEANSLAQKLRRQTPQAATGIRMQQQASSAQRSCLDTYSCLSFAAPCMARASIQPTQLQGDFLRRLHVMHSARLRQAWHGVLTLIAPQRFDDIQVAGRGARSSCIVIDMPLVGRLPSKRTVSFHLLAARLAPAGEVAKKESAKTYDCDFEQGLSCDAGWFRKQNSSLGSQNSAPARIRTRQ